MLIFDAPTREFCSVRRSRANTPLQALVLLNDPQFVEASRAFADRVLLHKEESSLDDRLAYAFQLATARRPHRNELKLLAESYRKQLDEYRAHPDAAQSYISVGEYKARSTVDPAELAAWTIISSLLLNLDETITKS
jgi:hypothetical protein